MGVRININIVANVTGSPGSGVYVKVTKKSESIFFAIHHDLLGQFKGYIKENSYQEVSIAGYGRTEIYLLPKNGECIILSGDQYQYNLILIPKEDELDEEIKSEVPLKDYSLDELQAAIEVCCKSSGFWRKKADDEKAKIEELSKSLKESEKRYIELDQSIKILAQLRDEQS